jgi:hypothetical protein
MDTEKLSMHTSITKRPLLRSLLAAIVFALVAGCGSGGGSLAGVSESLTGPSIQCANPGSGLAAVDLSGQCRVAPQATMGALEAVSG